MGSMLMRLAPLTTTGVGSLPFTRPGEAARHARGSYELPFCPQLPHAFGDMAREWLGADPGRCGWAPDRDRQLPAVWDDFILGLERHPPSHGVAKLQVTGPLTLAMALGGGEGLAGLAGEISGWLAAAVSDQVRGLAELGLTALVMVDEPGLMAAQQMISYDLARFGCVLAAQTAIRRLMWRGGRIMWGAVDPAAVEPPSWTVALVCGAARAVAGRRWRTGRAGCLPVVRELRDRRRG